jgi:hypothetical protein
MDALSVACQVALKNGVAQGEVEAIAQHVRHACERHRAAAARTRDVKPDLL